LRRTKIIAAAKRLAYLQLDQPNGRKVSPAVEKFYPVCLSGFSVLNDFAFRSPEASSVSQDVRITHQNYA